jgi:DNA-binding transcriptional regulator YdaS (Cro superfamily)
MKPSANAIQQLITLAGSQKQLAKLLGVDTHSIHDWVKAGKLSKRGALLVEASKVFNSLFKAHKLRPDIHPSKWINVMYSPSYAVARRKQVDYERSPEFKTETPIALIKELEKQNQLKGG